MSRRRREMYCGHTRLCICVCMCLSVCVSAAVRPHYCTDPYVTWGHGRGCPLVVHYWADLQSVHRLRCYRNITRTLVYAGCARVAISDRRVTEAFSTLLAVYRKWAWLAGRRQGGGMVSTLLRWPGLWASNGGVLATLRECKMLASTCLYSLYAWLTTVNTQCT